MRGRDLADLVLLAALWGGSFLFMRVAAPEFGPFVLASLRTGLAALVLLAILAWRGRLPALRTRTGPIVVVGLLNSALPFCLFSWAALTLNAGFSSILNATTPIWGALVAWMWLGDRLTAPRVAGLALGLAGVAALVWDKLALRPDGLPAIAAALGAALSYAVSASYARRHLTGVDPLALATGSQVSAAAALLPLAFLAWPARMPSAAAWACALVLAVASTAFAYILFFRLIDRVGPARAITVTFLVPLFAVLWGALFLDEAVTPAMAAGGAVVPLGTALATGVLRWPARAPA